MKKKLPKFVKKVLSELKPRQSLRQRRIYGDKLKHIVPYGSHARGDFIEGSDIDIKTS